jgi:hypothetical protein
VGGGEVISGARSEELRRRGDALARIERARIKRRQKLTRAALPGMDVELRRRERPSLSAPKSPPAAVAAHDQSVRGRRRSRSHSATARDVAASEKRQTPNNKQLGADQGTPHRPLSRTSEPADVSQAEAGGDGGGGDAVSSPSSSAAGMAAPVPQQHTPLQPLFSGPNGLQPARFGFRGADGQWVSPPAARAGSSRPSTAGGTAGGTINTGGEPLAMSPVPVPGALTRRAQHRALRDATAAAAAAQLTLQQQRRPETAGSQAAELLITLGASIDAANTALRGSRRPAHLAARARLYVCRAAARVHSSSSEAAAREGGGGGGGGSSSLRSGLGEALSDLGEALALNARDGLARRLQARLQVCFRFALLFHDGGGGGGGGTISIIITAHHHCQRHL